MARPKTECAQNAKKQARVGFSERKAKKPEPVAGIKKNQGTITLSIPKINPLSQLNSTDSKKCASKKKIMA